jgi:hypothetical protein
VHLRRQEVVEEERWQETYLQEVFQQRPHLKAVYAELVARAAAAAT